MSLDQWSAEDRRWATRYRTAMTGKRVPASSLKEREHELLVAVRMAQVPAAELFGDATAGSVNLTVYLCLCSGLVAVG